MTTSTVRMKHWMKTLSAGAILISATSTAGCTAPIAAEQQGAVTSKLLAAIPIVRATASVDVEEKYGVAEWRLYRGRRDVILTGYDADGRPLRGFSSGFHPNPKGEPTLLSSINDGDGFKTAHHYASHRTEATRSLSRPAGEFLNIAMSEAAKIRVLVKQTAHQNACAEDLSAVLVASAECVRVKEEPTTRACVAAAIAAKRAGSSCAALTAKNNALSAQTAASTSGTSDAAGPSTGEKNGGGSKAKQSEMGSAGSSPKGKSNKTSSKPGTTAGATVPLPKDKPAELRESAAQQESGTGKKATSAATDVDLRTVKEQVLQGGPSLIESYCGKIGCQVATSPNAPFGAKGCGPSCGRETADVVPDPTTGAAQAQGGHPEFGADGPAVDPDAYQGVGGHPVYDADGPAQDPDPGVGGHPVYGADGPAQDPDPGVGGHPVYGADAPSHDVVESHESVFPSEKEQPSHASNPDPDGPSGAFE